MMEQQRYPAPWENFRNMLMYHRKKLVLLMVFVMVMLSAVPVWCATMDDVEKAGPMEAQIYTMVDNIAGVNSGSGETRLEKIGKIINFSYSKNGSTVSVTIDGYDLGFYSNIISKCNSALIGLATMLLFTFFMIGVYNDITGNGQIILENLVKRFAYLVIGLYVLKNSTTIIYGICSIVTATFTRFTDSISTGADYTAMVAKVNEVKMQICEECNYDSSIAHPFQSIGGEFQAAINTLGYLIQLFLPNLVAKAADIVTSVTAWSRFIEITIFAAVSPLMFVDLVNGKLENSAAVRSAKNVLALALSGGIILISVYVCGQIQFQIIAGSIEGSASGFCSQVWDLVVISVVQLGLVSKANSLAKQVLGMA